MGFAAGQQQRMLISPLGEETVNLGRSIAGAIWLGAIGVALKTLIAAIAGVLLHFVNSMPRTDSMGFSRRRLLHEGILRPVACCFFSMFLMAAALGLITNGILLFASLAASECFAVRLMWRWNFGDEERSEPRQLPRKMCATSRRVTNAQA